VISIHILDILKDKRPHFEFNCIPCQNPWRLEQDVLLGIQNGTADYEAAYPALNGASTVLQEAETIEQLRGELATLEYRIQQAAVQAESERVSFLLPSDG